MSRHGLSCITPPHILRKLLGSKDEEIRNAAMKTLLTTARLGGERAARASLVAAAAPAAGRRTIFDCRHSTILHQAVLARSEDGTESTDTSVNRAFDGFGATRQFYLDVLGRNSIDGRGMRLEGYVHRGTKYNNAFWDGQEMVFGDGDGRVFTDFTGSLDVIGHELTHGVTEFTAGLEYHNQSGALNESLSDVFGSLVKQWKLGQTADQADWLVGVEVFTPMIEADALRSLKEPGTAYDNALLGKDPQPGHMKDYVELPDTDDGDNGGVHVNSGIPNKAFYLTAVGIGGEAWKAPGHIWYESLRASTPTTDFEQFANTTYLKAAELYGVGGTEQQKVADAWREVGIPISQRSVAPAAGVPTSDASIAALTEQVAALSARIDRLLNSAPALSGQH
jgi:Zn-dependent metalloprotease